MRICPPFHQVGSDESGNIYYDSVSEFVRGCGVLLEYSISIMLADVVFEMILCCAVTNCQVVSEHLQCHFPVNTAGAVAIAGST